MVALSAWPKGLKDACVVLQRSDKEFRSGAAAPEDGRLAWGPDETLKLTITLYQNTASWDEKARAQAQAQDGNLGGARTCSTRVGS